MSEETEFLWTVRDLAVEYVDLARRLAGEFSCDFVRSEAELWETIEHEINPLLVKHGECPIARDEIGSM